MTSRPNPKAFMYLALGTVVIGGSLCYFQYTKYGDVRARIAKLRTEASDPKAVQSQLAESTTQLEGAKQALLHLEANVSSAAYVPSLLRDLDGYGKKNGISVTGVRPTPKQPGTEDAKAKALKPYDELSIQITGTGSFNAIENFVTNLPTFPKIVAARMISIEPARTSGPGATPGLLNMTVQIKAYVFKVDAAADATSTPGAIAPTTAISGATAPAKKGAVPATQTVPAAIAPAKPGNATPAAKPAINSTPTANRPAPAGKTAFGRVGRVRVEG